MHINSNTNELNTQIALSADICLKPFVHSVISKTNSLNVNEPNEKLIDLMLTIQCRNKEGIRFPERDIELEIYNSGSDLSITLSWESLLDRPILWHGKYSLWMDSRTGKRCNPPRDGSSFESLARRIQSAIYE